MTAHPVFENPFRPGAGHMPPYLAGREKEKQEFIKFLSQKTILQNVVLTGLRGVGKTVLMDTFKPVAIASNWLWVGTDLSESASVSEDRIAIRLLADLSYVTSNIMLATKLERFGGIHPIVETVSQNVDYEFLRSIYDRTPGMPGDKLKAALQAGWESLQAMPSRGVIFAYDESQNLSDSAAKEEYPLSLMLDTFQSLQKKDIPFMLVLTGLPTLFPKLVEARTFAERMFHVIFLDRLNKSSSREALLKPIEDTDCPVKLAQTIVNHTIEISGGYPYFIQFLGREIYDVVLQMLTRNVVKKGANIVIPFDDIVQKLDNDFFAGRWARATDRQRDLLAVVASLPNCEQEFTVQEVVERSQQTLRKPFSASHVNQMFVNLCDAGLVFKNRHGKYSFAVPLLDRFIKRHEKSKQIERTLPLAFPD